MNDYLSEAQRKAESIEEAMLGAFLVRAMKLSCPEEYKWQMDNFRKTDVYKQSVEEMLDARMLVDKVMEESNVQRK